MISHQLLYIIAFILFILAGCPTGWKVGCQWFAFAVLTLTLIF